MILTAGQWTFVTTTTVDTLFQSRRGRVLVTTIDPATGDSEPDDSAVEITDHVQVRGLFVVPAGLSVWAMPVSAPPDAVSRIAFMPFGV